MRRACFFSQPVSSPASAGPEPTTISASSRKNSTPRCRRKSRPSWTNTPRPITTRTTTRCWACGTADFAGAIYMAEEVDPPMHGWARIDKYFNPMPGVQILDGIRNEYSDVRASYLAPDLAVATYHLRFDIKVRRQKPMSSWDRVMAVLRKVDGDWKLMAYTEAPMAPLTMVRRMIEGQVPGGFRRIHRVAQTQPTSSALLDDG